MTDTPSQARSAFERELVDMNEALVVSSMHQHELVEELNRFNRAAVARELRIIELKRESNESARRNGEELRYPIESGRDAPGDDDEKSPPEPGREEEHTTDASVSLESILFTEELSHRPQRLPAYEIESRALTSLVESLAQSSQTILRVLAEKILEVLKADSAGISLLTRGGRRFYWPAIAGLWQPYIGGGTPRDFGPCGDVLDRHGPLLLQHPERRYTYFQAAGPPVEEALLVPFFVGGKAVGTLWALSHGERRFDGEDLRQLESLGRFASAAYQAVGFRELERSRGAAALNLLEDAIESRESMRKVNSQLRASEERYRSLFTSIDEGFCVVEMVFDAAGRPVDYLFLETNPGFEKQTGLAGATGRRMRELAPHHEGPWFERYGNVALTGEAVRFVEKAKDLGGRWFDVYAFRLGEPDSRRVAILLTDISDRIRLENAAMASAKLLTESNRRKDEFQAMLSHELRNPLASITNASRLLSLQRERSPVEFDAQGIIDRQVKQLGRLVDDLLEVSRISTGRIRMQMERTDFRAIIRGAIETTKFQATQKGHSVVMSLPDEPLWVYGDPVRLEQVVVNLFNNAVKYTDPGGDIRVLLNAEAAEAVLRMRDNGMGIAPDVLPDIFDLYTQGDKSLGSAQGGLGIGLALVRSLAELHGGVIEVHSRLAEGSEFTVRLPAILPPQMPVAAPAKDRPAPRACRVLLVDDNLDAAQSMGMLLRNVGHDVRLAHDGVAALKEALEYLPDVILLDIGLPTVDGLEVARRIRRESSLHEVVLVALTGYGQESDRQRSWEAGFDAHLVKPVDIAEVQGVLSAARRNLTGSTTPHPAQ